VQNEKLRAVLETCKTLLEGERIESCFAYFQIQTGCPGNQICTPNVPEADAFCSVNTDWEPTGEQIGEFRDKLRILLKSLTLEPQSGPKEIIIDVNKIKELLQEITIPSIEIPESFPISLIIKDFQVNYPSSVIRCNEDTDPSNNLFVKGQVLLDGELLLEDQCTDIDGQPAVSESACISGAPVMLSSEYCVPGLGCSNGACNDEPTEDEER